MFPNELLTKDLLYLATKEINDLESNLESLIGSHSASNWRCAWAKVIAAQKKKDKIMAAFGRLEHLSDLLQHCFILTSGQRSGVALNMRDCSLTAEA